MDLVTNAMGSEVWCVFSTLPCHTLCKAQHVYAPRKLELCTFLCWKVVLTKDYVAEAIGFVSVHIRVDFIRLFYARFCTESPACLTPHEAGTFHIYVLECGIL